MAKEMRSMEIDELVELIREERVCRLLDHAKDPAYFFKVAEFYIGGVLVPDYSGGIIYFVKNKALGITVYNHTFPLYTRGFNIDRARQKLAALRKAILLHDNFFEEAEDIIMGDGLEDIDALRMWFNNVILNATGETQ